MFYKQNEFLAKKHLCNIKEKWFWDSKFIPLEEMSKLEEFKEIEKDAYDGWQRRPYYQMRGRRVTKEQAFDIIVHESKEVSFKYREVKNNNPAMMNTYVRLHKLRCYSWIQSFIDPEGGVGLNGFTYKYPEKYEFIEEHMLLASRYPYLEYVVIYTYYNEMSGEEYDVFFDFDCSWPILFTTRYEAVEKGFEYAIWVHDGGVEVVDKEKAFHLRNQYQAEYPCEEMFNRDDWNHYVKPYLSEEYLGRLCDAWELTKEEREHLFRYNIPSKHIIKNALFGSYDLPKTVEDRHAEYLNSLKGGEIDRVLKKVSLEVLDEIKHGNIDLKGVNLWKYWNLIMPAFNENDF